MEFESLKSKKQKSNLIMWIVILFLIAVALVVALMAEIDHPRCDTEKNESYALGFNEGVEQWNIVVIYTVNNHNAIPYWVNGSYFELNINQLCENAK